MPRNVTALVVTHPMRWEAGLERHVAWFLYLLDAFDPAPATRTDDLRDDDHHRRRYR